jgi:hypothetical protein
VIEVENLSKRYGEKLAVDGLGFVVQPGIVTGSCTARAGQTRLTDGPFSSCPANSRLTRRDCPAHRGLGRAVGMQNFDAGPSRIARTGMRGVVGGPG